MGLVGPYKIKRKEKKQIILHCLTMIDLVSVWFEMDLMRNTTTDEVDDVAERT